MKTGIDARLCRLESASFAGRVFHFWQPRTVEDLQALCRDRGVGPNDIVHLYRWMGEPIETTT